MCSRAQWLLSFKIISSSSHWDENIISNDNNHWESKERGYIMSDNIYYVKLSII